MGQPPKILVNGKPAAPTEGRAPTSSHMLLGAATEDDWAMAPSAGVLERGLAKVADGIASTLVAVLFGILSIPESPGYVLYLILLIYMMQSPLKSTPGKWLMGLRLVSTREGSVTSTTAILRVAAELGLPFVIGVSSRLLPIPGLSLLGVIALIALYARPVFHARHHAWHDTLAGTEVVRIAPSRVLTGLAIFAALFVVSFKYRAPVLEKLAALGGGETKNRTLAFFSFQPADGKSENPCLITRYCLTAYVTPWCPACEQTKPTLKRIQSTLSDGTVGVQVIMGQDQLEKLKAACADYGSGCGLDADETILKGLKIRSFPTYILWETSSRKRLKKPKPFISPDSLSAEEFKKLASERLGIPSS